MYELGIKGEDQLGGSAVEVNVNQVTYICE